MRPAAVAAAGLLLLSGCGGEPVAPSPGYLGEQCSRPAEPVRLPAAFPAQFPFPDGTVLTDARRESGASVVEGYIPEELGEARDFYLRELPANGFRLGDGDAEEHEAETEFSGHGYDGRLKLRDDVCKDALTLAAVVR